MTTRILLRLPKTLLKKSQAKALKDGINEYSSYLRQLIARDCDVDPESVAKLPQGTAVFSLREQKKRAAVARAAKNTEKS